jgi:hypothetical protein
MSFIDRIGACVSCVSLIGGGALSYWPTAAIQADFGLGMMILGGAGLATTAVHWSWPVILRMWNWAGDRRLRLRLEPTRRYIENCATPAPSLIAGSYGTFADWPIRALFRHLLPDLRDDAPGAPWEDVGKDVIDRIRAGQLQVWGREFGRQSRSPRAPLASIPAERWGHAEFTYFWLNEDDDNILHVTCERPERGAAPWQYCDLQFNRAQAVSIWPDRQILSLREAASTLYGEIVGTGLGELTRRHSDTDDEILDAMANMLVRRVQVWGKRPASPKAEVIGSGDKRYLHIAGGGTHLRDTSAKKQIIFADLEISRTEMARAIIEIKAMEVG